MFTRLDFSTIVHRPAFVVFDWIHCLEDTRWLDVCILSTLKLFVCLFVSASTHLHWANRPSRRWQRVLCCSLYRMFIYLYICVYLTPELKASGITPWWEKNAPYTQKGEHTFFFPLWPYKIEEVCGFSLGYTFVCLCGTKQLNREK